MSKVDAMRAMREARHAAARKAAGSSGDPRAAVAAQRAPLTAGPPVEPDTGAAPQRCGHRNMGGKSCSRPAGHSEKNHRYATS